MPKRNYRSYYLNFLLAIFSLITILLVFEFIFQSMDFPPDEQEHTYTYPQGLFISNSDLDFKLAKGFRGSHGCTFGSEFCYKIRINNIGCFDDPFDGTNKPILLIGDSFTWGFNSFKNKWGTLLEKELGQKVGKCGILGYGPEQELKWLLELKPVVKPKLVVLGYFIGNDLIDDFLFPKHRAIINGSIISKCRITNLLTGETKCLELKEIEDLYQKHYSPEAMRKSFKIKSTIYCELCPDWIKNSKTFKLFTFVFTNRILLSKKISDLDKKKLNASHIPFISPPLEWIEKAWRENEDNLFRINSILKQDQIKFLIVIIPTKQQVYVEMLKENFRNIELPTDRKLVSIYPNKRILKFCKEKEIQCLDLLPHFRIYAEKPFGSFTNTDLYYSLNEHFSEEGEKLAGRIIAKHIIQKNLLPAIS